MPKSLQFKVDHWPRALLLALLTRLAGGAAAAAAATAAAAAGSLGLEAPNGCLLICVLQAVPQTIYIGTFVSM